jgi:hypothetical protein
MFPGRCVLKKKEDEENKLDTPLLYKLQRRSDYGQENGRFSLSVHIMTILNLYLSFCCAVHSLVKIKASKQLCSRQIDFFKPSVAFDW